MKLTKTASGEQKIKMSKTEWESMGKKAGWIKESQMEMSPMNMLADSMITVGNQMKSLEDMTDDIDDVDIQARANQLKTAIVSKMDVHENFKYVEDLLMQLDQLQSMYWDQTVNDGERVLPQDYYQ